MERSLWLALLFVTLNFGTSATLAARGKPELWTEVRSPHFTVVTDAGAGHGRSLARMFERVRSAFHRTFPTMTLDPPAPIVVVAVKSDKEFAALNPSSWQKKGHTQVAAYFEPSPDINYVVVCLSRSDQFRNSYGVIIHEYTHLLIHQYSPTIPLWLDEGLAEYYGHSEIYSDAVAFGVPSRENLEILRSNHLLPLKVLLTADHNSPYYSEENKSSIFYAESWLLTHYMMMTDFKEKKNALTDYMRRVSQGTDSYTAAAAAFGDLKLLFGQLVSYRDQSSYSYLRMPGKQVAEKDFTVAELPRAQSAAIRGDLLTRNGRYTEARSTLESALQEDPKCAAAAASMGFLEFEQKHDGAAQKWFAQAVALNARDYLAYYYFAAMSMRSGDLRGPASDQVEKSLRTAIQIDPTYAPAYDLLAQFYGRRDENLDEAHMLSLRAISLDRSNVYYRLTTAQILMRLHRVKDAIAVAEKAETIAKKPGASSAAEQFLARAQQYQAELEAREEQQAEFERAAESANSLQSKNDSAGPPVLERRTASAQQNAFPSTPSPEPPPPITPALRHEQVARGAKDLSNGTIQNVQCYGSSLSLELETAHQTLHLYSNDYFKVQFSAADYIPRAKLYPCSQIQGRKARILFYDIKGHPDEGEIIAVSLQK